MSRYNEDMNQTDTTMRRVAASVAACANIPLEALENEKCLIERLMDAIADPTQNLRPRKDAWPTKIEVAPKAEPVLTPELIAQVEQLEANAKKYFDLYQGQMELNGQLKMQLAQLQAENERLKRKT